MKQQDQNKNYKKKIEVCHFVYKSWGIFDHRGSNKKCFIFCKLLSPHKIFLWHFVSL